VKISLKNKSLGLAKKPPALELLSSGVPSESWQKGRRLVLKFMGTEIPELDRIEFHGNASKKFEFLQKACQEDKKKSFQNTDVAQAISIFFLDCLCARLQTPPRSFLLEGRNGSPAASLAYALAKNNGKWYGLFTEFLVTGDHNRVSFIFGGKYAGRGDFQRVIFLKPDYLPPDCIGIIWNDHKLSAPGEIQKLTGQFRKVWKLPPPSLLDLPMGEGDNEKNKEPVKKPEKAREVLLPNFKLPKLKSATEIFGPAPKDESVKPAPTAPPESQPARPQKRVEQSPAEEPPPPILNIPAKRIDPHLFEVPPSDGCWPDEMPLMRFDSEEETFEWTLQNAFEGVLIMGATGSGKTSGSGTMLAESFLDAGFGGLVLTVKDGETQHWRELCQRCGRGDDLVVVRKKGDWKLNVLAYESQRPGGGGGLADNMVAFCRNLLKISTRSRKDPSGDGIWQIAGDQLLNATFDLFILAGIGITFDRLHDFIAKVPAGNAGDVMAWRKIQLCSSVLSLAEKNARSGEDLRLLERAKNYWFTVYPALPGKTRAGVTLGIFAMLDAFRGRDVPAVISSDTNITPEGIMSGKIVVLDLPIKEHEQAGLLVQSAWKYLFQKAIERQSKAGRHNCRPVFLWEDEGQYFFSDHDHHFQDTARSARVSRVILSQNLHSFYKEFGREGEAAANNVFGNLNTKIFHYNDDPATNQWASRIFGSVLVRRTTTSSQPTPEPKGIWESYVQTFDPPKNTGYSSREEWEPAIQPNEFLSLRNGGLQNDFLVDAYISWQGLTGASGSPFIKTTFNQKQTEE
jgi:hypothetical protein